MTGGLVTEMKEEGMSTRRKWSIAVGSLLTAVVLVAGGFYVGVQTRMSGEEVKELLTEEIALAVEEQQEEDAELHEDAMDDLEDEMTSAHLKQMSKVKRKWAQKMNLAVKRAKDEAYDEGYSSGNSAGYNSGVDEGFEEGLEEGSDSLTCSDDPDVTWLPYCNW